MIKQLKNTIHNTNKRNVLCWILIAVGIYTITPFLFIAQYNQPSADDFSLAVRDLHNPLSAVLKNVYFNWSGRYLAPVISRLNPLISHPGFYKIYPIIMIVSFVGSVIILTRELLRSKATALEILAISSICIYLVISQTSSIAEAFYWFSGSCIYQTANIATLVLIIVLFRLKKSSKLFEKRAYTFVAALLCILIIGCNEISMVTTCFIIFSMTVWEYQKQKKADFSNLFLTSICLLFSAAVIFAPGNFNRIGDPVYFNKSIAWTMFGATSITILNLLKWGSSILPATLVYTILFQKTFTNSSQQSQPNQVKLKWLILSFVAVFFALQLLIFFTAGGGNLGRIENNMYLFFLLAYAFILHLFLSNNFDTSILNHSLKKFVVLFAMLLFLLDVFNLENNISSAYIDIISGRAKKYDTELKERLLIAQACKSDTCYVPALSVIPKTLFVTDIRPAIDSMFLWINDGYSKYYNTAFLLPASNLPLVEPNIEIIRNLGKDIRKNIVNKQIKL